MPSLEQLNQQPIGNEEYARRLSRYFNAEEAVDGNKMLMPVPVNQQYLQYNK